MVGKYSVNLLRSPLEQTGNVVRTLHWNGSGRVSSDLRSCNFYILAQVRYENFQLWKSTPLMYQSQYATLRLRRIGNPLIKWTYLSNSKHSCLSSKQMSSQKFAQA